MSLTSLENAQDGPECTKCDETSKLVVLGAEVVSAEEDQVIPMCTNPGCDIQYFGETVSLSNAEDYGYNHLTNRRLEEVM